MQREAHSTWTGASVNALVAMCTTSLQVSATLVDSASHWCHTVSAAWVHPQQVWLKAEEADDCPCSLTEWRGQRQSSFLFSRPLREPGACSSTLTAKRRGEADQKIGVKIDSAEIEVLKALLQV